MTDTSTDTTVDRARVRLAAVLATLGRDERENPACCDHEGRRPADEEIVARIGEAIDQRGRPRRRPR